MPRGPEAIVTERHRTMVSTADARLQESERFHLGAGKVHETLKALAKTLDGAGIDYAIIGALALNLHGYARETVDVDVLVRPDGLEAIHEQLIGLEYRPAFAGARKAPLDARSGVKVEFVTTGDYPGDGRPKPVAFPDPAAVAVEVAGAKVVNLPTLIDLKLASGMTQPARRKDLADVQETIRILGLDAAFAERLNPYVRDTYLMLLDELRQASPRDE